MWLIVNQWLRWQAFDAHCELLHQAACARGMRLVQKSNAEIASLLANNTQLPDKAIVLDKDIAILEQLERAGVRLYNPARAVGICDDKARTYAALSKNENIAQPRTLTVPMRYRALSRAEWEQERIVDDALRHLGFPLVLKRARSSWGAGVSLIEDKQQLVDQLLAAGSEDLILQEFVEASWGRDIRAYFIGDRCVAAMQRRGSAGDFRANLSGGGRGEIFEPTAEIVELGQAVMKELALDMAGLDIVLDAQSKPLLCEVNSNAQITGLTQATGVDVAGAVMDYVAADHARLQ